ncbi:MAG: GNAT family N-acetyltransferase [Streptosporangiales bacterium]|nr:GNAT family N-acetyltransferase [Streptosporangiales bacterium]
MEHADASVRPAVPADTSSIAAVQVRSWRAAFDTVLPATALEVLTGDAALTRYAEHWTRSIERPPSRHHRVLTALAADTVTGFGAYGPSPDEDRWPRTDAELLTLAVDPDHRRAGHGSRLLNAAVDLLREDGFETISTWSFADDQALRSLLTSAGWAADGSRRELDLSEVAPETHLSQVRLVTRIA